MYRNLRQCVADLEAAGQLRRIDAPVDPNLEVAEIQRRVFRAAGPALLFTNVVGCRFPMLGNLFGTMDRIRYLFRDSLDRLRQLVALQVDPADLMRRPRLYLKAPWSALLTRPRRVRSGPVLECETTIGQLPQLKSWPDDGGAYITLPQVYTEDPDSPGLYHGNLGMYRVQLSGGRYDADREVGLHYQIQRGIAAHHAAALRRNEPLRVNVFVGGPPAMTVAAVMPLPEGMSELTLAGVLGRRRVPMICRPGQLPIHAEADFCITGSLDPKQLKPEGPFGDHLGYYSLAHEFPVMRVEHVYHRRDAIWPFTVVGRPPQEDSMLGQLIHELVGPVVPRQFPGVKAVEAVDAAGVHPLLLAIGSERYVPYDPPRRPRELMTLANALLGQGQLSLAKYLWIVAAEDAPGLSIHDVPAFFRHALERVDWRRDLHFQTCTTLDTLDYTSGRLNEGSKLAVCAAGPAIRRLPTELEKGTVLALPEELGFRHPRVVLPGVLVLEGPPYKTAVPAAAKHAVAGVPAAAKHAVADGSSSAKREAVFGDSSSDRLAVAGTASQVNDRSAVGDSARTRLAVAGTAPRDVAVGRFCDRFRRQDAINAFPLIVIVDRSDFAAATLENFLWTTFTRSDPATDVYGIESFTADKHWGCHGSLVIDARTKPHHAPPLVEDPAVTRRVDALAAPGGPLHGII
ncbi:MAG: UbiD family decarboxylase [Thermoguttaceae bacterium]